MSKNLFFCNKIQYPFLFTNITHLFPSFVKGEFLNYVIVTRSLKKVFVTIKGFYFQAEIKGKLVTWLMPHNNGPISINKTVDMKIVTNFTLLYTTLLGFINFRLYQSLGLIYPPNFSRSSFKTSRSSSNDTRSNSSNFVDNELSAVLCYKFDIEPSNCNLGEENDEIKQEQLRLQFGDDEEQLAQASQYLEDERAVQKLFEGCKFFINCECPKEYLIFIIRYFLNLCSLVSYVNFVAWPAVFQRDQFIDVYSKQSFLVTY